MSGQYFSRINISEIWLSDPYVMQQLPGANSYELHIAFKWEGENCPSQVKLNASNTAKVTCTRDEYELWCYVNMITRIVQESVM